MKYIDHFYSYATYSGSLEGPPTVEQMYKSARRQAEKLWGDRSLLIIEPPIKPGKMLPKWTHMAWVTGPPMDKEADGSHLIVVWFSEESCFNNYEDVIGAVDWNKHAEDFGW